MLNKDHILIVGGSSGIGLSLARLLGRQGAQVTIASRSKTKLKKALDVLNSENGTVCFNSVLLDASDVNDVQHFFSTAKNTLEGFKHIISTIKPEHVSQPFLDSSTGDSKSCFDAKFWGQYFIARYGVACLSPLGSIILTSGIAASRAYKGYSVTAAINGAIESLVKSLALELSPIRVNAVSPGFIERKTNDLERFAAVKELGARIPSDRLGQADEVAQAYLYLINNHYTNGTVLTVDGGELAG